MPASVGSIEPEPWSAAFRALASPLEYASEAEWIDASLSAINHLVGGCAGIGVLASADGQRVSQLDIDPDVVDEVLGPLIGVQSGRARFAESALDRAVSRTVALGIRVWDFPYGERMTGIRFREKSPFYRDVMERHDLQHVTVARTAAAGRHGFLGIIFEDGRYGPLGSESVRAV